MLDQWTQPIREAPPTPYHRFDRVTWSSLRDETPLVLSINELNKIRSLGDPVSTNEVRDIYMPASRLLRYYADATKELHNATHQFLRAKDQRVPFIIGVAGSVAVGKSTTSRMLQWLMQRWPSKPTVALVTTDGFLRPNAYLRDNGLMRRKGFPESYDTKELLRFLSEIKGGVEEVRAPVYSHLVYDIVPNKELVIRKPDILILEGLNVLQTRELTRDGKAIPFVSDFFDFSIFLDADEALLRTWYIERFSALRTTSFRDPNSYFNRYAQIPEIDALEIADDLWTNINLVNLKENILPTRLRADLVLTKGSDHRIEEILLRRL